MLPSKSPVLNEVLVSHVFVHINTILREKMFSILKTDALLAFVLQTVTHLTYQVHRELVLTETI